MITPRAPSALRASAATMPSADWLAQLKVPPRLTVMVFRNNAGSCATPFETVLAAGPIPAQFIKMRSCPLAARRLAKPARTLSGSATSTRAKAPPRSVATARPSSSLRSKIPTGAPTAAKARATASPRPEAPPVTTIGVLSEIRIVISHNDPDHR